MECKTFHITNIYVNGYALQIWELQNVLFRTKLIYLQYFTINSNTTTVHQIAQVQLYI